jgi:hypothetical protein
LEEGGVDNILHLFWGPQFGSKMVATYTDITPAEVETIVPRKKTSSRSYDILDLLERKDIRR